MYSERTAAGSSQHYYLFLAIFGLSGVAGLIYEIVWVRELTLVLGASTYAVTIILAAFMGGLGLGSWWLGKRADGMQGNRLARFYVLLEGGIALFAILLPSLIDIQQALYIGIYRWLGHQPALVHVVRLTMAFVLFVIPTCLMGATLPVMSRYLIHRQAAIGIGVARLYAINTLGAAVGIIGAGYVLLPLLGNSLTNLTAAGLNLLVAGLFWFVHGRLGKESKTAREEPKETRDTGRFTPGFERVVAIAFAGSGTAAMIYEVAWTRTLTMLLGTTTYAFTTMLATFVLGIALGSMVYRQLRRVAAPRRLLVSLQFLVGLSALITIPLFEFLPLLYLSLIERFGESWLTVQLLRFSLAGLVMLLPAVALGVMLPVVSDLLVDRVSVLGRKLGRAYAYNTLGAVTGTLAGGLLIIPVAGLQATIVFGAFVSIAAGIAVLIADRSNSSAQKWLLSAGMLVIGLLLTISLKPWSPRIMASGVYVYADRYLDVVDRVEAMSGENQRLDELSSWETWRLAMKQYSLLYYDTGPTAVVSVMEDAQGTRFLTVDGKTDASTSYDHDMKMQTLLGQLPMLFHPAPRSAFVIGLGSGVTVGTVLTHAVDRVCCAEISPCVIAASALFGEFNHHPLQENRLTLMRRDARNALMTSSQTYDVVISQPSNPWISGQSSLFTTEFYELIRSRLNEDGIFAQWVPAYHMTRRDVRVVVNTLQRIFPHVTAWSSGALGELILLAGKDQPLNIDFDEYLRRVKAPRVSADIRRLGYDPQILPFVTFVMDERQLLEMLYRTDGDIPQNSDDHLLLEFSTPKRMASGAKVDRFVSQDGIHGDPSALLKMMTNVDLDAVMVRLAQYGSVEP